jgi:hypothetical protein
MKLTASKNLGLILAALGAACFSVTAQAQTFTGTGANTDYGTGSNWSSNSVPSLSTGATAIINNGTAVTYNPGGDFIISNGGTLQVTNGSWTQINGNNWIQLGEGGAGGNGHILVNGGTFNQGTDSNSPFQITGTGNTFTITSGAANFTNGLQGGDTTSAMSWNFAGGNTVFGGEINYTAANNILIDGGTVTTTLFTATNSGDVGTFTLSSGELITTQSGPGNPGGFYAAAPTAAPNFTLGSTASIDFEASPFTSGQIAGYVAAGDFDYNGVTGTAADFTITPDATGGTLLSAIIAAPEPTSFGMGIMAFGLFAVLVRRRAVGADL